MTFTSFLESIQASSVATTIENSLLLTAGLSATHLIGFTLLMGGAFVSHLRLMGLLLARQPLPEVAIATGRGIRIGLAISVVTGLLLVAPRAVAAAANGFFQIKMACLVAAAGVHFALFNRVTAPTSGAWSQQTTGAVGLTLWSGVALAGCAFILLE